ncbi:gibberellin 2-beta-dioxygenase 2-like [Coffea eugenioides]|uniref:gibberellin 2beta-dioxygenase n=1 Tax=Coffea arabica TaxID=13443 RepID=A0A6P6X046_COFAR|nr:gibberellin 2-beta-dioxygenase 2-like [Coffea arabica]XP_027166801.1 gibberellin 2-beta-dioxygenase 2-like [Coffea eugenioides]
MVVAAPTPDGNEKTRATELPVIDLSDRRSEVSKLMVKACEDFGFFKLINHGVADDIIAKMEEQSYQFFAKPSSEKELAGPSKPYGYGCRNIGCNGDVGEVEYLILDGNPASIARSSETISADAIEFRCAVRSYVEAVRALACEILEVMAEGLGVPHTSVFSALVRDVDADSLLRLNHYPPVPHWDTSPSDPRHQNPRIGFGEHTDPQILTLLRSNDVRGLQISLHDGVWVPVDPHPQAFFVNVGDVLQAMTNGRFLSVKHRATVSWYRSRMSMAYFASPPLRARIGPIPEMVTPHNPPLYRSFTWDEYKKATYSRRLGDGRLNMFRFQPNDELGK